MKEFKVRLQSELPNIEKALLEETFNLPKPLQPIAEHIFKAGGKRIRPFLIVLMARLLGYKNNDIYRLAVGMEMLHAATLLHDDVLDSSNTRRGQITAHKVFGVHSAIFVGDALLAAANNVVASFDNTEMFKYFCEATLQTATGEILELQHLRKIEQPENIYNDVILGKTAWLLRASCAIGAMQAKASGEAINAAAIYGEQLGIAFQMVDDALDFAPQEITGKPTGGDLIEGKLTPPVLLYRQWLSEDKRKEFDLAFNNGSFSTEDAERIGAEICANGFDVQTRELAGQALEKAREALQILPQAEESIILMQLTDYVQNRNK